ncbi:MAG: InlB B-repeat-containing protein [Gaiellaceae bacterium]
MSRRRATVAACLLLVALVLTAGSSARRGVARLTVTRPRTTMLPAAAQGVVARTLGRADHRFFARRTSKGFALHAAGGVAASFTAGGVAVQAAGTTWRVGLRAIGRGPPLARIGRSAPAARANRVSYARKGLVEWYANGPLGLEQGFTVRSRPAGTAPLTLALGKLPSGLHAQLSRDRRSMSLARGRYVVLRYRDLAAHDAHGKALPAKVVVSNRRLSLRIDDRGASYPLRIDPFVEEATLSASDPQPSAWFGFSVAVSGDTIAVGAQRVDSGLGAVYVFVKPGGGWASATETAKLTASDGATNDYLGSSVAIDGDTIVAGAPNYNTQKGKAYVFVKPAGGWGSVSPQHETAKLTPSSDLGPAPEFGYSVAISGNTIAIGAWNAMIDFQGQGAVYVFVKPFPGGWADAHENAILTASDAAANEDLGGSVYNGGVGVAGNTIVAGAGGAKIGSNSSQGAIYVFVKPDGGWGTVPSQHESAKLTASDGVQNDGLGRSGVAISASGNTIAGGSGGGAGDKGAVYVFVKPVGGWVSGTEAEKGTASGGSSSDNLGQAVAASDDTVVATAPNSAGGLGSAYIFLEPSGGWSGTQHEDQKLVWDGPLFSQTFFGYSVAYDGSTLVAGAYTATLVNDVSHGQQGAVNVFEPSGGGGGTFGLTVSKAGNGTGRITSSPAGIDCGEFCSHSYTAGTMVTLNATAGQNSVFSGYSGACSGMSCTVTMSQARSVTATFTSTAPTALFTMPSTIRPGAVTTLNANASLNATRYLWDLNGDGHNDVSCSTSQLQTQFMPTPGSSFKAASSLAQARLTVVSATGATSTASQSSPFSGGGTTISAPTYNFFQGTLSAYCVNFRQAGICITPSKLMWGVVEASGCDLHQVTGLGELPSQEDKTLVQSAIDQYNNGPAEYVTYVKALCAIAKLLGDPANCAVVSQINRRDINGPLMENSILLWVSRGPVTIDGLVFTPAPGHALVVSPLLQTIFSGDVSVELNGAPVPLPHKLSLSFRDVNAPLTQNATDDHIAHVAGFDAPKGVLPGLAGLVPRHVDLSFVRDTSGNHYTQINATLGLPQITPDVLSFIDGSPATVKGNFLETNAFGPAGVEGALQLSDVHATLNQSIDFGDFLPLKIDAVQVDYLASAPHKPLTITGSIHIGDADLSFAPQAAWPNNGIVFWDGGFKSAGATLDLPCPDLCIHLFPGVDLDQIAFNFALHPTVVLGGGDLNVIDLVNVHGGLAVAFPSTEYPWTLNKAAIAQLPDDWTPRSYSALTVALAGDATMNLPILKDQTLANAYFVYSYPGYIAFGGGVTWNFLGIVSFDGGLSGEVNAVTKRFNFAGHLQTCVADVLCSGAFGVVSSSGAGACFVVGPVSVGGGIQFPDHVYIWPIDGCKWSRFTADNIYNRKLPALGTAAQPYSFTIKSGDPSHAVRLDGDNEAPAVEVTGPGGIDVTSGSGDCVPATSTTYNGNTCMTVSGKVRIMRSPRFKETAVGIENPVPGTYTITPVAGSSFTQVFKADDTGALQISGSVSGSGALRTLSYNARAIPGEKVTFLDVSAGGAKEIGTVVGGGSGNLRFAPPPGTAVHQVVAEVELAGLPLPDLGGAGKSFESSAASPGGRLTIATFHPPKPLKLGVASHLQATRRGKTLKVTWRKASGAVRYAVVLTRGDGTAQSLYAKHTSASFAVARTDSGRVTVRAIAADGRTGKLRHVGFKATAKSPTLVAAFPAQRCVVPKVVGLTERQADKALLTAGCEEGKVTKVASRKAKGRVLKQSSAPRSKHPLGTRVNLVVGR